MIKDVYLLLFLTFMLEGGSIYGAEFHPIRGHLCIPPDKGEIGGLGVFVDQRDTYKYHL